MQTRLYFSLPRVYCTHVLEFGDRHCLFAKRVIPHCLGLIFRRQRLMYSTRVCSLVNLRGGWVGRGGNPPAYPPTPPAYPPTPPPTYPPTYPPPPTHPQLASSSTDTFKQRENQNKEKLTKVAAYEL